MEKKQVTIGGVHVHLAFDLLAWFDVEDAFESMDAMRQSLMENKKPVNTLMKLLAIEANAGERRAVSGKSYTEKWMKEHVKPWQVPELMEAAYNALAAGLERETDEEEADVDVVAQELAKKEKAGA